MTFPDSSSIIFIPPILHAKLSGTSLSLLVLFTDDEKDNDGTAPVFDEIISLHLPRLNASVPQLRVRKGYVSIEGVCTNATSIQKVFR